MAGSEPLAGEGIAALQARRDLILARWLQTVRTQPFHRAHPDWAVADHIPLLLDALLRTLAGSGDQEGQGAALAHARQRAAQGLDSGDVVTEFRLLRRELQHALGDSQQLDPAALLGVEIRLHDELDRIVTMALRAFDTQARARADGLEAVSKVAQEIAALRPLQETLQVVCDRARTLLQADQALVVLPDAGGTLAARAHSGEQGAPPELATGAGVHGQAYTSGQPAMSATLDHNPGVTEPTDGELSGGIASLLAVPLARDAQVLGALSVGTREVRAWSSGEIALLGALASQTSVALENARLFDTLQQRERLLDQVVDNAPALIAVVRGPEHRFELVNPRVGLLDPRATGVGQPAAVALAAMRGWVARAVLDRARGGEPVVLEEIAFDQPGRADGGYATRYFTFSFLPLAGAGQTPAGVLIVGYETTEAVTQQNRIQALATLAAARADTLVAVIGSIPDGLYVCDSAGQVVSANRSGLALLGWPVATLEHPIPLLPASAKARMPNGRSLPAEELPISRALRGEVLTGAEVLIARADTGEDRLLRFSAAPIKDTEGAVTGAVCVASDLTARQQADRQRDEFISRASHELKTPLTSAKGLLQLAGRRIARGEPLEGVRPWIETAERQIDKLAVLVEDLRSVSQLRAGGLRLRLSEVGLRVLVDEAVLGMQTTSAAHHLIAETGEDPLRVQGDPTRLSQVLDNLLSNAIKYSPAGGEVRIRCRARAGQALVEVQDSGIGIPAADRAALFRPFYRATNADDASTGMGLGLYISREIALQHHGDLQLLVGGQRGSTFLLSIPLLGDDAPQTGREAERERP